MLTPENVTGPLAVHAEGPVWWERESTLLWVDGSAGDLLSLTPDGIRRQHVDDDYLAFVRPRVGGGLVAVGERTLYLSGDDGVLRPAAALPVSADARMNDGGCDPRGGLFAGSMAFDGSTPAGELLHIDTDLRVETVLTGVTVSNGLAYAPDHTRVYYVDSATRRIDLFDVRDGALVDRRPFAEISEAWGLPDGLTVAADGSVWVALWGGGAVQAYDADGEPTARIELAVPQVSACTFGGADLATLYITTSAQDLPDDHGTDAGSVYAVRPGVTGLPVLPFAG